MKYCVKHIDFSELYSFMIALLEDLDYIGKYWFSYNHLNYVGYFWEKNNFDARFLNGIQFILFDCIYYYCTGSIDYFLKYPLLP